MSFAMYVRRVFAAAFVIALIPLTTGCEADKGAANEGGSKSVKERPLPSFSFHKPKEFDVSVARMRELHNVIISDAELPAPIKYQVKEIVHGTGASGHSHFYLHEPGKKEDSDDEMHDKDPFAGEGAGDDGHETTDEKIHDVAIGPFEELKDLTRWMPEIASDSDMPEEKWNKVNKVAKDLRPKLYEIIEESTDADKRRTAYRATADAIDGQITELESLTEAE